MCEMFWDYIWKNVEKGKEKGFADDNCKKLQM